MGLVHCGLYDLCGSYTEESPTSISLSWVNSPVNDLLSGGFKSALRVLEASRKMTVI